MDTSTRCRDLIRSYEGYSATAYDDGEGVWTIGWGSIRWSANKPVKRGDTITKDQAELLFRREIERTEDAIDATVKVPLTQGQFDCLVSWGYNVGIGWITGKGHQQATLIKLLNKGQYDKIPGELVKFRRGANSGRAIGGLLTRRKRELKELWFSDHQADAAPIADQVVTDPAVQPMPQAVAPAVPTKTEIVKESPTAQFSILGLVGSIALMIQQAWAFIVSLARDAGSEVVTTQPLIGPYEGLLRVFGLNMKTALLVVVCGCLLVVLMRKLNEGRA